VDILSAIASINAIIIAFLITQKKQKSISDYILIAWVINFAFHFAIPFLIERQVLLHESHWAFIMGVIVVAHAPFIFIYTNSLTNPEFKINFRNFYHFGVILIFIAAFIPYFTLNLNERMELVEQKQDLSYYVLLPLLVLLLVRIYFLVRTTIVVINHQNIIKQSFSYEKEINLAWIKRIVIGLFVTIIIGFIGIALVSAHLITVYWMDYIIIICNMVLFFYLAFSSYKQKSIQSIINNTIQKNIKEDEIVEVDSIPNTSASKAEDNLNPVIQQLKQLMESDKLYLEPELNIGNVANQLKIHSHQLSKLINSKLEKNFFEFVNEYRVREFKKLVSNPKNKHISILGLAMDAGFNSKATFNRIFKNTTGFTPSEFRENYRF